MKIITFATLKGGTGKTTNLFNVAGILAEKKRVLLIDMDPQCNLTSDCGIDVSDETIPTVRMILENVYQREVPPEDIIIKAPIKELPKLDLIPSSIAMFHTEENLITRPAREFILINYIEDNRDYLEKNYDYIMLDTNPSMSTTNINAFYASDSIVLSSDVSANGIRGAELFGDIWEMKRTPLRKEDNVKALIICNVDKRTNLAKSLEEYARKEQFSKDIVLKTTVPTSAFVKRTELFHKPSNVLYPRVKSTEVFREILKELKKKGVL